MNRSYIVLISLVLFLIEVSFGFFVLNETHNFTSLVLPNRFAILFFCFYTFCVFFSVFYMAADGGYPRKVHYQLVYGEKSYNFLYTYHFLVSSIFSFCISSWLLCLYTLWMFCFWNWIRVSQNKYSIEHKLHNEKLVAKEIIKLG